MDTASFDALNELALQRLVRMYLTETPEQRSVHDGSPVQVLSIGEWNHGAGPDFFNVALLADGRVHIGNAEFHRKSSDWQHHDHSNNAAYDNLLLHIVLRDDACAQSFGTYTIVLEADALRCLWEREQHAQTQTQQTLQALHRTDTLAVLHEYAMRRVERKTAFAQALVCEYGLESSLERLVQEFIQRRQAHKRRPKGLVTLDTPNSDRTRTLHSLVAECALLPAELVSTCVQRFFTSMFAYVGGKGTRTELLVNVLAPCLFALWQSNTQREHYAALTDYLQTLPCANRYTSLERIFPHVPQETVWQQQGLLEYYAEVYVPSQLFPTHTQSNAGAQCNALPFRPQTAHTVHGTEHRTEHEHEFAYVLTLYT
jgi:hypothetical protein